jgi:hypothetical protein
MDRTIEVCLLVLAALGFVGWLGGGRKWAFRTIMTAAGLLGLGVVGVLVYAYTTDRIAGNRAKHRLQKIHSCAIAKVATAKCEPSEPTTSQFQVCDSYWLPDAPTSEQENTAIAAAEKECEEEEVDPTQESVHHQLVRYRKDHGIAQNADKNKTTTDEASVQHGPWENYVAKRMNSKDCAAKVRTFSPGAYDDLDDATLSKKVLAKYPAYCDVTSSPPAVIPGIKNIR